MEGLFTHNIQGDYFSSKPGTFEGYKIVPSKEKGWPLALTKIIL